MAGEVGSADTARPARFRAEGTEEGNWDMVGKSTPVFFVRDPEILGLHRSQKRDPAPAPQLTMQWDFWSLSPSRCIR